MKIKLGADTPDAVGALPASAKRMSNFDHSVDDGLEADLRAGMRAQHAAWEFCGTVWWDAPMGQFMEIVERHHVIVAAYSADNLRELMREVNDEHGWD